MSLPDLTPIFVALVISAVRLSEIRKKRDTIKGPIQEQLSLRLFLMTGTVMLLGAILEYVLFRGTVSWPFLIAGVIVAILSFTLRRLAIRALGKFWSLHVEIRQEHQFVTTGPFRWVRHPTYLSMVFELVAIGLVLRGFVAMAVVIPFLFVPALLYRLKLEEAALVEKFGGRYVEYQKRVPALIPTRIPRPR